mgnify:FL=1
MSAAIWIASSLAAFLFATAGQAAGCRETVFDDAPFTICKSDPAEDEIRLFLDKEDGQKFGGFDNVNAALSEEGKTLAFAMNAGMYHPDRRPVGLYIEDGNALTSIVTRKGPGNFGLLPNGVLCLTDTVALIVESRAFDRDRPACRFATQSGPMLVIDGALHPRFLPQSTSRYIRNGVGVARDGTLFAVISDRPVTFHHFARLFRDVLKTPQALFLDGNISRLYAADLDRHDIGFPLGPILGVARPAD